MNKSYLIVVVLFFNTGIQASDNGSVKDAAYFGITPANSDVFFKKAYTLLVSIYDQQRRLEGMFKKYQTSKVLSNTK